MRESPDVLDQSAGGPMEVEAFVYGALVPITQDRDLIVEALNRRFSELGRGRPIPCSDG